MSLAFVQQDHDGAGDWPSRATLDQRLSTITTERDENFAMQDVRLQSRARVNQARANIAAALADLKANS